MAIPMATRIEDAGHTELSLPKEPIVPGQTTRDEVERRYSRFTTATGITNLYWGRFRRSTWGGGVVGYPTGGSRAWSIANILVSFGPDGTAARSVDAGEKQLLPCMTEMLVESGVAPAGRYESMVIEGSSKELQGPDGRPRTFSRDVEVELTDRGVAVTRHPWGGPAGAASPLPPPTRIDVRFADIARIESLPGDPDLPATPVLKFSFRKKTVVGDHVTMDVSEGAIPMTAHWLARFEPSLATGAHAKRAGK